MRRNRFRLAVFAALCITIAIGVLLLTISPKSRPQPSQTFDFQGTTVTVDTSGKAIGDISDQYIGLSFESDTLNSGDYDNIGDLPQLLENLGSSVIRFGGTSVDRSFQGLSPSALAGLKRLVDTSGWTVLYTEDLGRFNATEVTADARTVSTTLGSSLFAFACGNEPDQYRGKGIRAHSFTESDYLREVAACYTAIRAGAPHTLLEGPDTAASTSWLAEYASKQNGVIAWLGQHYYALGCGLSGKSPAQAARILLSPAMATNEVSALALGATDARVAHAQLWLTETQSACNGGAEGVSDSYAAALWAINYILTGAEHGVHGMTFHGGFNIGCQSYTPLCQAGTNEYTAQPVYYGMLFTHLLGSGHLLPVRVSNSVAGNVAAFALKPQTGGGIRLMIENLGQHQTKINLVAGGDPRTASVLQMTGPSLLSTSGVKIQGSSVGPDGRIKTGAPTALRCKTGGCPIVVDPYTAVLVSIK